jgi:hypothetical protein
MPDGKINHIVFLNLNYFSNFALPFTDIKNYSHNTAPVQGFLIKDTETQGKKRSET